MTKALKKRAQKMRIVAIKSKRKLDHQRSSLIYPEKQTIERRAAMLKKAN